MFCLLGPWIVHRKRCPRWRFYHQGRPGAAEQEVRHGVEPIFPADSRIFRPARRVGVPRGRVQRKAGAGWPGLAEDYGFEAHLGHSAAVAKWPIASARALKERQVRNAAILALLLRRRTCMPGAWKSPPRRSGRLRAPLSCCKTLAAWSRLVQPIQRNLIHAGRPRLTGMTCSASYWTRPCARRLVLPSWTCPSASREIVH